jgi:hypothetical protein
MSLYDVFVAADGKLPAQDGQEEVVSDARGKAAAVIAFPAHFYVLAPVEPEWVHALLSPGDFSAPLGPRFLISLADRLGAGIGANDAVLAARVHGHSDGLGLREVQAGAHPRAERARRYRDDVRVWETRDGPGRGLTAAALGLLPAGTPVFAQVSPGNCISRRATLAAGYSPIGGEVLLPRVRPWDRP